MPPPFVTGRPAVVVRLILASLTFFFLVFLSQHHSPSFSPSSPHISRRSPIPPFEKRPVTVTSSITRSTTVFVPDSVTVTLESGPSSPSASSASSLGPPSVSFSTSVSPSSTSAPLSPSVSVRSSSLSSSRTTRSTTTRTPSSTSQKSVSSSTSVPAPTTSDTLILVPTTLSVPTPSTTFTLNGNPSPSTLVVVDTATSSDQVAPSSPPSVPVQASNSGTGFWSNKGAVGGTFAVVTLVILGAIIFLVVIFLKRIRRNRARKLDDELYGNLFEPNQSRASSPSDARSLTYSAIDPFAAPEVVQIRNGGASLPTVNGMSYGPSAFKNIGHGDSDDGHSSNDHSSSNHHGFSSISYRTGAPDARGGFAQAASGFYQPPPVSLQAHPQSHNNFSNFATPAQSTSMVPPVYGNPNVGQDAYYIGQVHPYYHGAGATGPPEGSAGRAF